MIGWGHKIKEDDPLMNRSISEDEANQLLISDFKKTEENAKASFDSYFGYGSYVNLNTIKKQMIIDYCYNMGVGGEE